MSFDSEQTFCFINSFLCVCGMCMLLFFQHVHPINWFATVLYSRHNSHWVMGYDPLNVPLNLACWYHAGCSASMFVKVLVCYHLFCLCWLWCQVILFPLDELGNVSSSSASQECEGNWGPSPGCVVVFKREAIGSWDYLWQFLCLNSAFVLVISLVKLCFSMIVFHR